MCRQGKNWISWFQKQSSHRIDLTTTLSQCGTTAIFIQYVINSNKICGHGQKSLWDEVPIENFKKPVFLLLESGRVSAAAALRSAGAFLHLQLLSFFITRSSSLSSIALFYNSLDHHHYHHLHLQLLSFFIAHSSFIIIINCTFL